MLYQIVCATPGDLKEQKVFLFDTMTNEVYDSNGRLVDFRQDERFKELPFEKPEFSPDLEFSPSHPITKQSRHLKTLKIQLGMACNYHCKYCLQNAYRDGGVKVANEETIEAFFKSLDDQRITLDPHGQVELWGGEPLVYWKTIKILLPKIRNRFGHLVRIKLITNGSLLTKEKVDFLIEHRVKVIVSHDGPGFDLRDDIDPLDVPEIKETWLYLLDRSIEISEPMGICVVITPKNVDLFEIKRFFATKFSPKAQFYFEGIVTNEGAANDDCCLTPSEAKTLDSSVFRALVQEEGMWDSLEWRAFELMNRLVNRIPATSIQGRCDSMNPKVMVVDLYGRIGTCQNRPTKEFQIGALSAIDDICNPYFTCWTKRPVCDKCLVISSCKGSCPHLTNEGLALCCPNEFVFNAAIFGAVWFRLTGRIMIRAEPIAGWTEPSTIPA